MKRGRGRVLVGVVLWLGIGLALAVVSAMGIAVRDQMKAPPWNWLLEQPEPWWPEPPPVGWPHAQHTETDEGFGSQLIQSEYGSNPFDFPSTNTNLQAPASGERVRCSMYSWRVGWPLLSFKAGGLEESLNVFPSPVTTHSAFGYLALPQRWGLSNATGRPIRLPIRPIWPGLLVNTLFFTALVWVPLKGVGFVRRANRRKRGRCSGCGYDLRGSVGAAVCPECGRGVLRAVVAGGSAGV